MGRLLVGVAGTLFGTAPFAAGAMPIATGSGWLPTLGSFALGGLLGSLLGSSGFAAAFVLTVLVLLAAVAMRIFAQPQREPVAPPVPLAGLGSQIAAAALPSRAGEFDAAAFLRTAKLNFVKLRLADDLGRPEWIRDLTTAEIYEGLRARNAERGGLRRAEVVSLSADLLKVVAQGGRDLASVRFSGLVRQDQDAAPVGFEEIWSLSKPVDSASGWLLAGIQRTR